MKKRILVTAIIMATTTIVLPIYGNATGPIVPITLGTDAISLKQVPEANDKIIITDTDNKFGSEPSKIKVTFTVINTVPAKTSDGTDISFLDAKKIAVTLPPEIYGYCNIDIFVNENKVYTGVIQLKQAPTTKTPEKIAAGWMLLRPLSLTTDLYNSNQITQTTDSTVFTKSSQPQGGYNASISYNLRLSTLDYIFTPHDLTPSVVPVLS